MTLNKFILGSFFTLLPLSANAEFCVLSYAEYGTVKSEQRVRYPNADTELVLNKFKQTQGVVARVLGDLDNLYLEVTDTAADVTALSGGPVEHAAVSLMRTGGAQRFHLQCYK